MTASTLPAGTKPRNRKPCKVTGCESVSIFNGEGRCFRHYAAMCKRAGSIRVEGFDQEFADLLAAAGFQVVGRVPVVDVAEMPR